MGIIRQSSIIFTAEKKTDRQDAVVTSSAVKGKEKSHYLL
jgi:hypothetical protein